MANNERPSRKFGPKLVLGTAVAVAFISLYEGGKAPDGSAVVYADKLAGGLPTVCAGLTKHITTTPIVVGDHWSAEKCTAEESVAIIKVQLALEQCFNTLPPQAVFDAATSHAWNNGVGATCGSVAMQYWNQGEWALGCERMAVSAIGKPVWSYVKTGRLTPDGKPEYKFVPGLAKRRSAEFRFCLTGVRT